MKKGSLKDCFDAIAAKRLSAVECNPDTSNQHEFNGATRLKKILGIERRTFNARFVYLSDDEEKGLEASGFATWYDARENHPTRTEHRLYFPTNSVMETAEEGDLLVVCKKKNDIMIIVAQANSTVEHQLFWLFDLPSDIRLVINEIENEKDKTIDFVTGMILERLGINIDPLISDDNYLENLITTFPGGFPTTKTFSLFSRQSFGEIDLNDPDAMILSWMDHEEKLFRTFERYWVQQRLKTGFGEDVDSFISFSLSVHNRRKSRAGFAFENHLEELFKLNDLKYQRGAKTENKSRPDFLFPGEREYHDQHFPVSLLAMLGVKTTCKDRWRQILAEANRIEQRHLATLEPGISEDQTNEMTNKAVQLVIPERIHQTYSSLQKKKLLTFKGFITLIKLKQQ